MFCMYVPMILFVRVQSILQIAQDQKKKNHEKRNKNCRSYFRDGIMQHKWLSVVCLVIAAFISLHSQLS